MKSDYIESKLEVSMQTRIFRDIDDEIKSVMTDRKYRGRWTDRSHFVRCAIIYFLQKLDAEQK